jgi:hypothetical protein
MVSRKVQGYAATIIKLMGTIPGLVKKTACSATAQNSSGGVWHYNDSTECQGLHRKPACKIEITSRRRRRRRRRKRRRGRRSRGIARMSWFRQQICHRGRCMAVCGRG